MRQPGDFIKDELEKRRWNQTDLAMIMGRSVAAVNQVIQGNRSLSTEIAVELGLAFGTGAEIWMERETNYRLSLTVQTNTEIERRTRLYHLAPIKDMISRQWINKAENIDELEKEICNFFDIQSIDKDPEMIVAARKFIPTTPINETQRAWCYRARRISKTLPAAPFKPERFEKGLLKLKKMTTFPEQVKDLPRLLPEMGVRLVIVEHLPQSKIDGAAFWLDKKSPVVALSIRYDRIDCFWYTLCHELSHIKHEDALSIDDAIVGDGATKSVEDQEHRADEDATNMLIDRDTLNSFIIRVKPFYSKQRIIQFANRLRVHPGIITGQLQHLGEMSYASNRDFLVKVRDMVVDVALTDGWGKTLPSI